MALIFYMSSTPVPEALNWTLPFDPGKHLAHLAEYAILSILLYYASRRPAETAIVSSLYGLTDEVHQHFVPTRLFDLHDLLFNCIGAVVGSLASILIERRILVSKLEGKLKANRARL